MKHGKKPTMRQKTLIAESGLNLKEWLVTKDTPSLMEIVNRNNGSIKEIEK